MLRIVTALLLPIALAVVAWMALAFNLLNPDVASRSSEDWLIPDSSVWPVPVIEGGPRHDPITV